MRRAMSASWPAAPLRFAAVTGTVTNQSTGKPQAGATVALYKLGTQIGLELIDQAKSDAQGNFTINQTPQGPHLIRTAFDGVTYNHMLPPGRPTTGIPIEVYNASKQPGEAKVAKHMILFEPSARAGRGQRDLPLQERRQDGLERSGQRHAEILPARGREQARREGDRARRHAARRAGEQDGQAGCAARWISPSSPATRGSTCPTPCRTPKARTWPAKSSARTRTPT